MLRGFFRLRKKCVFVEKKVTIIDKKNGEMTMLDKICIGEIIDENDEQEL